MRPNSQGEGAYHIEWEKLPNNPFLKPDLTPGAFDGTVAADPVFVLDQRKIWLYYKGNPNVGTVEAPLRSKGGK